MQIPARPTLPRFALMSLLAATMLAGPAFANDGHKPDDRVTFALSAESWVTTTTARVTVNVDAAVAGNAASGMRAEMQKAVNNLARSDWRLTGFSRSQDSTGLERWYASFETRLPESDLAGIHDSAKKAGKAGLQLTVGEIAFDPTLAETEAVRAKLRADIYKQANEQLSQLNGAIQGRQYRIGAIDFINDGGFIPPMAPRPMMMKAAAVSSAGAAMESGGNMERAQKITQQAQITFAALPPAEK